MNRARREALVEDLVRLRRVEKDFPGTPDLPAVRVHLEEMVGPTVRPAFAARVLGVSPPALRRWVSRGDIATVFDLDGSRAIPLSALVELKEAVDGERAAGRRHVLEGAVVATRKKAERLPRNLAAPRQGPREGEEPSDVRGLAYHRAVARRLDRPTADMALALVRHWKGKGSIDPRYAESWEELLEGPLPDLRRVLEDESRAARDLRQNSPFAGVLSEAERRAIADQVR
jgi:hypothetical protein